jgi:hypothetical protein
MNLRDDDTVSAVALVMESAADTSAEVEEDLSELATPPEVEEAPDAEAPEVPDEPDEPEAEEAEEPEDDGSNS